MILKIPTRYVPEDRRFESFTAFLKYRSENLRKQMQKEIMKTKMKPVEVFKSFDNKQWYFRVRARNGEILCQSEGYKNKKDCEKALSVLWSVLTKHLMPEMD